HARMARPAGHALALLRRGADAARLRRLALRVRDRAAARPDGRRRIETRKAGSGGTSMLRILIWLALLVAAGGGVRRLLSPPSARGRAARQAARRGGALAPPEAMIDCARCGVHLPASEALRDGAGRPYCCAEHRDAGPSVR